MDFREHPEYRDFIEFLKLKGLMPRTLVEYERVLKSLFAFAGLGEAAPSSVSVEQIRAYLRGLQERGLNPKTVADRVTVIKRFFGFLHYEGYLTQDPSKRIPYPRTSQRLPKALTREQVRKFFARFDERDSLEYRDKVFFLLAYTCGLRLSEVAHLKLENLDLERGTVRVIGKGDKERRVYLKPSVSEVLREYAARIGSGPYLFANRKGRPLSGRNMDLQFEKYAKRAQLPDWATPHKLRHSIAVHFLMSGAPLPFLQQFLGHANLGTTGQYLLLEDETMRQIAIRMPNALDEEEEAGEARATREQEVGYPRGTDWERALELAAWAA